MKFYKTTDINEPATFLAKQIKNKLGQGNNVLWLVPGGSAIAVAVKTAKLLNDQDLHNLTVSLTDERYGEVGHPDSNWRQLDEAGFKLPGARLQPILQGDNMEVTTEKFAEFLQKALADNSFKIGLFGIGADGHTAGILPQTPAVTSDKLAVGYQATEYQRITMTPPAIAKLDMAIVYALGQNKHPVVDKLTDDVPLADMPSQALKQVADLIIYNDYKGEY